MFCCVLSSIISIRLCVRCVITHKQMTNSLLISMFIVDRSKRSCIWTGSFGMVRSSLPFSVKVITSNTWFNSTKNVPFLKFCYFIVQIHKTHRNFVLCVPWFPTNAPSKSQNYLHCCTMPSAGDFDYTSLTLQYVITSLFGDIPRFSQPILPLNTWSMLLPKTLSFYLRL